MGKVKKAYNVLGRKPDGKRLLRRPMHRLEDNNRIDLKEIGWQGVKWMHLT
jgi:hypothetical protein